MVYKIYFNYDLLFKHIKLIIIFLININKINNIIQICLQLILKIYFTKVVMLVKR